MMNVHSEDNSKSFTRRAIFVGALQIAGICTLGGRLAWLQIVQGKRYKTLSDENRISIRMIAPLRGQIVDRFGVPLAINIQNYRLLVIPEQTKDLADALKTLKDYIQIDDETITRVIKESARAAKFIPIKVKEDLTWEEVAKIEVNLPDLPGMTIDKGEIRNYPYGEVTAHIIGYVRAVGQNDLDGDATSDPVLRLPGFKIGKTGIEKVYDLEMRGKAGASEVEVNVHGREVRELDRKDAQIGQRVTLTLDGELQRYAQEVLSENVSATAVVMDVHTGAVYAMASHPSFDPNMFVRGVPHDVWQGLLEDPARPQTNKALAGQYPPGSTFKMVTALAGLEAGVISSSTSVFCPGHYSFGDGTFHCWKKGGHGTVDLTKALRESCDTFFYKASTDIGIDRIAKMARQFGLGEILGFEVAEEKTGLVPDVAWKKKQFGVSWQPGETIVASIGQGYYLTTPLQLAVMVSRIVNGARAVKPWITAYVGDKFVGRTEETWPELVISEQHLAMVRKGMEAVVNSPGGTAYGSRITTEGMEMGGKTGTAQVQRITKEQRRLGVKNEDLPWEQRHHALFVGYAPMSDPKYACAVVVEHGVGGAKAAAPIAKALLQGAQERNLAASPIKFDGVQTEKLPVSDDEE